LEPEGIELLETNLDDVSGEVLGSLYERLMDEGARDVSVVPVQMKKNRPGHIVKVVARRSDSERLARVLAEETGTLGVRSTPYTHRFVADRRVEETEVEIDGRSFGVGVKVASSGDDVFDVSAEFEDAKEVADETGLPVRRVMQEAEETWRRGR
ncbi:MAG: nickel insertion protein, partial [Halobacteria archaeon]|nr:nickel insertion protein [Halobacteria archaeon]